MIATAVALPPNVFPLKIIGVVPQVLPLILPSTSVGPFTHPQDTWKIFPVAMHPDAFLTEIRWLPFTTPANVIPD